ncbi:hypothetical protein DFH08DRAFT_861696 [Mycena albidolilacea]|uniref:Transmembrane protein n=1 Tax=Mycena albidolilacea TaxID=1033008 RepID=A0AAD7EUU7_9AGAR|nr:hypothetical protein DFH08DRAFT_861696 [Mycena albidolilacea]
MQQPRSQTHDLALRSGDHQANPSSYGGSNYSNGEKPSAPPPPQRSAQAPSPDEDDEKARRQASKDLTQSWMDRLQLISVITTFFASTEAGMLQVTQPGGSEDAGSQVANSAFLGALVLHIWAAIISFMAAFFLVRYKLKEAKEEQKEAGGPTSPSSSNRQGTQESELGLQRGWTANPHLEEVGPFQRKPPTHLLARCHNLCILLTFIGFALALLGILAFAWAQNPVSVGVVASVSTAACFGGAAWVFMGS